MEGSNQKVVGSNAGNQKEDEKTNENGKSDSDESIQKNIGASTTPVGRASIILNHHRKKTGMTTSSISQDQESAEGDQGVGAYKRHAHLLIINEDEQQVDFDSDEGDSESSESLRENNSGPPRRKTRSSKASILIKDVRRRSAIILHRAAYGLERRRLPSEMDLVKSHLKNTYRSEGDAVLLHGYLHIQIIRAKGLRNMDLFRGCHSSLMCNFVKNVSDPYVTVHAGSQRLLKTPTVANELNPEWNLDFFVPICHPITHLEFRVKDNDSVSSETLGKSMLPVHELIRFASSDNENGEDESTVHSLSASGQPDESSARNEQPKVQMLRTGVHKIVHLDNVAHHGSLEYFVEFIPKDLLHTPPKNRGLLTKQSAYSMIVPGVYFPLRQGNRIRLYVNADDKGGAMGTPPVRYGGKGEGLRTTWKPRRFFRDVYDSICHAKHIIYIVGWSVDYTISLLRGKEQIEGANAHVSGVTYSPNIGELLNQKASEGVVVNMLVWDDMTSNSLMDGVVATRDEQLRNFFRNSKINLRLVPMVGGEANMLKKFRMSVYYTHHQKCVIVDNPKKELVAYVGGIDLTYGRYEDGSYSLFRSLRGDHKEDFHNACAEVSQVIGPREPWHDIHSRVMGPGTLDLLKNFEERWVGQGGDASDLVRLEDKDIRATPVTRDDNPDDDDDNDDGGEAWNTQLYRSIDERTAKLTAPYFKAKTFTETEGVEFDEKKKVRVGKRKTFLQHILKTGSEKEQHFVANNAANIEVARPLDMKRDVCVDSSAHRALVHHIRNAQHSIYIESQYFLSSSFLWKEQKTSKCCNLVAAEIAWKICEKIESTNERFAAYIVVPMWPEGLPDSSSVQDILWYQSLTMKSMYTRIQQAIDRRRKKLEGEGRGADKAFADVTPTDYLNFYCLANRETEEGREDASGCNGLLNQTRRHLVYTHSKMTIVDDAVILCGSANINQRSLDGGRDSELLMGSWQPNHLATANSVANGDVHGFRLHCWAHLTGIMVDAFRHPSSLECVRFVNKIAKTNWENYVQEEACEMKSYLVPFPVKILENGDLAPLTDNGKFPDTNSNIMGTKGTLPKFLTT